MSKQYFTVQEANELTSFLEETFQNLISLNQKSQDLDSQINSINNKLGSNGSNTVHQTLTTLTSERNKTSGLMEEHLNSINQKGILVKSIEQGLVDFPSIKDGREIYLCWNMGEESIDYWHEIDSGYSGRQPI
tara:strand:- start:543 stop:941 length:399 start_codon:yes stop_codon:yes gene_type:complete